MSYRLPRALIEVLLICSLTSAFPGSMATEAMAQTSTPAPPSSSSSSSSSQQKTNTEEGAVIERILNRVRFENDGTEVSETEAVVRIQSQAGVEEFGQLVFGYSSATEKLAVEYVRVRKPDGRVVVTPDSTAQ